MVLTSANPGPKRSILTYHQWKAAREIASSNQCAINADIDQVFGLIEEESRRSVVWFQHQFYQGGHVVHQKRAVSVFNAAKQINAFLEGCKGVCDQCIDITEDEKACFTEIKLKIKELDGVENACKLPADMQDFLKVKALACTHVVIQDARHTLDSISSELLALTAHTDMETVLFAVKGKAEHSMPGYISVSGKAECYLIHGLKKYTSDIVKELETYVLTDVAGLTLNHNGRLAEIKRKIHMEIIEGLVVDKRVKLVNWPEGIPFVNASDIGSLHDLEHLLKALTLEDYEDRCHWVTLSEEEWQQCQKAYYDANALAEPKRRKRKGRAAVQSDSNRDSSDSKNEETQVRPKKRSQKAKETDKENDGDVAAVGKKKAAGGPRKGTGKSNEKGATKSRSKKGKEAALAPASNNQEVALIV
ncbi:hypothetical protein K439DRAFT_1659817 [Ramaria rubella]|nr:hypothetical protein K439DRAFT_1659817 [Ramaria rubella]